MRNRYPWIIGVSILLLAGGAAWGQTAQSVEPAQALRAKSAGQRPALAIIISMGETASSDFLPCRHNLEDFLMIELANQPFLQLVDRQALQAVLKEHAISQSNLADVKNAPAIGKFVGADYLLNVLVEKKEEKKEKKNVVEKEQRKNAVIRLVETATGQVKLESQIELAEDPTLVSVAIREKVLAALRPDSQAANRLTVGIAAFPNRSGTDRSDKLGIELQKALRSRLREETWAVVLERQYPTSLLDEADLARAGLVRDKGVESLPPADLAVSGSIEDADGDFEPEKPWEVKLALTLRLRGKSTEIEVKCRSDAVEAAAGRIMEKIDEFRRQQPAPQGGPPEKELWRRQAMYLMPQRCVTWGEAIVPNFMMSSKANKLEAIRAWENVLLLDNDDPEAVTYLGVCMIGFNRWSERNSAAVEQMIAGSRLVERALRGHPNRVRADTFIMCIDPLLTAAPARATEMAQYVVDHRDQFTAGGAENYFVKAALLAHSSVDPNDVKSLYAVWDRVIENAEKDPNSVILGFSPSPRNGTMPLDQVAEFLEKYLDSSDPVVQFVAQRNVGKRLCLDKDAAGLPHLDKAIDLLDKAYPRCSSYGYYLTDIYQIRIEACQLLGLPEEAKKTAIAGTKHFMETDRFDNSVAWLYYYCVTRAFGAGQEKEALAVCDAYLAAVPKHAACHPDSWPSVFGKREELLARLNGKPVPSMNGLQLVRGTELVNRRLPLLRMTVASDSLWLVVGERTGGSAMGFSPDRDEIRKLTDVSGPIYGLAATKNAVFFGTSRGLFKLAFDGKLIKHYRQEDGSLPSNAVMDVCEGGGKIYFSYSGGIAVLDPPSDKITVLAPSNHETKLGEEPRGGQRIRWDAATPRLYACFYPLWYFTFPELSSEYGWSPQDKVWKSYPIKEAPLVVASQDDEALIVRLSGDQTLFHFVKSGQDVTTAVPVSRSLGEPAWDENRLWAPTSSGLYEVDRATGRVAWLAYEEGNPFLSVLKHGNRLYIATTRGLYYLSINPISR